MIQKKQERRAEATAYSDSTKKKKMTQEDIVLQHLRVHGSITSMTAIHLYEITRLSAVIFNLREDGYHIATVYETSKESGKTYGRYYLKEESDNERDNVSGYRKS